MDYETKMLLWNISKQTEIANAIKLGEMGTMITYGLVNKKCQNLNIKYGRVEHTSHRVNHSVSNVKWVAQYWDEHKPKEP